MKKRIIASIISVVLLISLLPITSLADDGAIGVNGTYDIGDCGDNSTITIDPALTVTLTNTNNITYTNIKIVCGAGVALTIDNIKIDNSIDIDSCALSFSGDNNHLFFTGSSNLISGNDEPGIRVKSGTSLVVNGTGSIEVTGGYRSAGIGGGFAEACGNITISSGTVTATGGEAGAGIGGSCDHSGGTITIEGSAEVAATGGDGGAGIGGGSLFGSGGTISIKDNANVIATGGYESAGIGGGRGGSGGNITISGGTVTAQGGEDGAGIGGGNAGNGGTIIIEGGAEVTATGGYYGAGIGGGFLQTGGNITICGGTVTAQGGTCGTGIGGGYSGAGGSITISGGYVSATGGVWGAGVGSGYDDDSGNITISGGTVAAVGGQRGAGIGGGSGGNGGNITVNSGIVSATGGESGAGIGGGAISDNSTVSISGGTVTAKGGENAAGIGGGEGSGSGGGTGGMITIGGTADVTATGGRLGAGIGSGYAYSGDGGTITIYGSADVTAKGGRLGAGIGGGYYASSGIVTISGGMVTAKGGDDGAGIGSGYQGDGTGIVHIKGGVVMATGGYYSAGIGGSIYSSAGTNLIEGGTIYAEKGIGAPFDIGEGKDGSGGTLSISDAAAVFLKNGDSITPKTSHTFITFETVMDGKVYGLDIPLEWTAPVYAFLNINNVFELVYNANGGSGSVHSNSTQYKDTNGVIASGSDLCKNGLAFVEWNTQPDGEGISYEPGVTYVFKEDIELYAIYEDPILVTSVALGSNEANLFVGGKITLMATVSPANATNKSVTWSSSNTSIATISGGTVTAVGAGTAVITVTTQDGGFTDACTVTVKTPQIKSTEYSIDRQNGCLKGVNIGTSVSGLKANLTNDAADIKVYDVSGNEYTGALVSTGMKVKLVIGGTVRDELTIVILGDVSGDGYISIADYTLTRLDILRLKALVGAYVQASDVNGDGVISIADYTLIRLDILGLKSIH